METTRHYLRPPFEDCLAAWRALLTERRFPTDMVWILEENLCFERDRKRPGGVRLGFQTQFTPQPPDAAARAKMIRAEDIAECVMLCLSLPPNVIVEEMLVRPR